MLAASSLARASQPFVQRWTGHEEESTMGNKPSSTNHPFPVRQEGTKLNPGDEGDLGTPGMAENVCRECKGTGKIGAVECPICGGTGVVYEEIGGG
jgi:hypothetical protein